MAKLLNVYQNVVFDEDIVREDFHSYYPRTLNYDHNDEIKIEIQQQDIFTAPCDSYIILEGVFAHTNDKEQFPEPTNNWPAFLFQEMRYLINGEQIDVIRNLGMTTMIKGYVSYNKNQSKLLEISGWSPNKKQDLRFLHLKKFTISIPLKHLMGFAEDYRRIIMFAKQELIFIRNKNDINCYKGVAGWSVKLNKIAWCVPHIQLNQQKYLELLTEVNNDRPIPMPFRRWELLELPAVRETTSEIWNVKTSTSLERPRYIVIAFQTNKMDVSTEDIGKFDHCFIRNIKIYLNSETYPYESMNLKFSDHKYTIAYNMYSKFQNSYYGTANDPTFSFNEFRDYPLFVFDVSKQNENLKSSVIDLKIEFETDNAFKENTRAYCFISSDTLMYYRPLSSQTGKLR